MTMMVLMMTMTMMIIIIIIIIVVVIIIMNCTLPHKIIIKSYVLQYLFVINMSSIPSSNAVDFPGASGTSLVTFINASGPQCSTAVGKPRVWQAGKQQQQQQHIGDAGHVIFFASGRVGTPSKKSDGTQAWRLGR